MILFIIMYSYAKANQVMPKEMNEKPSWQICYSPFWEDEDTMSDLWWVRRGCGEVSWEEWISTLKPAWVWFTVTCRSLIWCSQKSQPWRETAGEWRILYVPNNIVKKPIEKFWFSIHLFSIHSFECCAKMVYK